MVYIILPVHDRLNKTGHFLDHLLQQTCQDYHLILVDDGSTDGTGEFVTDLLKKKVTILKGKGNWWWGGSLHQGYRWITRSSGAKSGDHVLIMNNDTIFDPAFIETGISLLDGSTRTLLTAQAYSLESGEKLDEGVTINWDNFQIKPADSPEAINCLSTRGLIMHYGSFVELGGFHPVLLPHYLSDYEYTYRAYKRGFKLITNEAFKLSVDETTTGLADAVKTSKRAFLTSYFSKRHKANPIYHMSFILLASPNKYKNYKLIAVDFYQKLKKFFFEKEK